MNISFKYIALLGIFLPVYFSAQTQQTIKKELSEKLDSLFNYPIKIGTLNSDIFKKWNNFILTSVNSFMKKNITMDKSLTATWEMVKRANNAIITTLEEWDMLAKKDLLSRSIAIQSTKILENVNNDLRKIQESPTLTKKYIIGGNNKAVYTMKNVIDILLQISNRTQRSLNVLFLRKVNPQTGLSTIEAFALLGFDDIATEAQIKNKYKKLVLRWNTQKSRGNAQAAEELEKIQKAYDTLIPMD